MIGTLRPSKAKAPQPERTIGFNQGRLGKGDGRREAPIQNRDHLGGAMWTCGGDGRCAVPFCFGRPAALTVWPLTAGATFNGCRRTPNCLSAASDLVFTWSHLLVAPGRDEISLKT
jgi:hypothetical protein